MSFNPDFVADKAEMARLLADCNSERIVRTLQDWDPATEVRADLMEMEALLKTCDRPRVRTELAAWADQRRSSLNSSSSQALVPATSSSSQPAKSDELIPTVLIAGDSNLCQRRLVEILAGAPPGCNPAACEGLLETKYYSARLHYQATDLAPGRCQDLTYAEAVILLWDPSQPKSFDLLKEAVGPGRPQTEEDEQEEDFEQGDEDETLRLCVAISPSEASFEPLEDEALGWCAKHGYEFLRCPATDEDFQTLRERVEQSVGGASTGILEQDTDGTLLRIREALECQQWSNLARRASSNGTQRATEAQSNERPRPSPAAVSDLPTVLVAGAGDQPRLLVSVLSGQALGPSNNEGSGCSYDSAQGTLKTKYYTADLHFTAATLTQEGERVGPQLAELIAGASAILFVVRSGSESDLQQIVRILDSCPSSLETNEAATEEADAGKDKLPLRTVARPVGKIKFLVASTIEGQQPPTEWATKAQHWALEHGLEYLACPLNERALKVVGSGLQGGQRLLDDSSLPSATRIVEALQCHAWPNMQMVTRADPASTLKKAAEEEQQKQQKAEEASKASKRETFEPPKRLDEATSKTAETAVEAIDHFAAEIKSVRNTADEATRRERACQVAMRLAEALGVDDSDSD